MVVSVSLSSQDIHSQDVCILSGHMMRAKIVTGIVSEIGTGGQDVTESMQTGSDDAVQVETGQAGVPEMESRVGRRMHLIQILLQLILKGQS